MNRKRAKEERERETFDGSIVSGQVTVNAISRRSRMPPCPIRSALTLETIFFFFFFADVYSAIRESPELESNSCRNFTSSITTRDREREIDR